jgi:protoporphyrinogen/coproporphyrinogen III oxidase
MWSFREGLRVLTDTLAEQVGGPITTGVSVRRVERTTAGWAVVGDGRDRWDADAVVLTCPAFEQAAIVADLDAELAEEMAAIRYNRIVVAALGYRRTDVLGPQDGFGYIAPQNTRRDILGVQWCSSIFPDRAPPGYVLWRVLCGGVNRSDVFDWSDDEVLRACDRELRLAMGVRREPVFSQVVRWPRAIPQYEIGHPARVARIEALAAKYPGLYVTGNAYHGVAMNDVTEQAERIAARLVPSPLRGEG